MYFKFAILLLFIILAANSVLGENEDEIRIVRKSYDACRQWLRIPLNKHTQKQSTITVEQFWLYMGKYKTDLAVIERYMNDNPDANDKTDCIDLHLYGELFKVISKKNNETLPNYANHRKIMASIRTPEEMAALMDQDDSDRDD